MNTTDKDTAPTEDRSPSVDPQRVLESIVSELEWLLVTSPAGSVSDLTRVHGALLAYNLDGRAELLPKTSFGLSSRSWRERAVVRAARRIIEHGAGDAEAAMDLADEEIRRHLHLIDPDLATRAA